MKEFELDAKNACCSVLAIVLGVALTYGCGAKDVKLPVIGSDGGSSTGGASGTGAATNGGTAGADAATGGVNPAGGEDGTEPPPRPLCETGALRCSGDTPERCEDERWIEQSPCGGRTPACVNGVCSSVKLVGALMSMGQTTSTDDGAFRLIDHGFEYQETGGGMLDGRPVLLTGGIHP